MKNLDEILRFYAISDDGYTKEDELLDICEILFDYVTCFQVRNKAKNYSLDTLLKLKNLSEIKKVALIINDDLDLAIRLNANGIHLGQSDINKNLKIPKNMFLGISASNYEEALKGLKLGANYLGIGAIHKSNTKKDAKMLSKNDLIKIMQEINIPKVAIGGLNYQNIDNLKEFKIKNIACISAIYENQNYKANCEKLWKKISLL